MRHVGDPSLGAVVLGDHRCLFRVWAPLAKHVQVRLLEPGGRVVGLEPGPCGYHQAVVEDVRPGARYRYVLDGQRERSDPASRSQPEGVHGPSQVVDPRFDWTDHRWCGIQLQDFVLYELHLGTFTPEGTFDAAAERLDDLAELGITAVEIMPVSEFPGDRNWGYDGVYPYAVHRAYGGPEACKRFVDACHRRGMAVVLDVVYNHFGPEGNYLWDYAPYFTDRYRTPWGSAVNFDGSHCREVRRYFVENALMWITDFHVDALRLDAVHAIMDLSAKTFLEELAEAVHRRGQKLGRWVFAIGESDLNDPKLVLPRAQGGFELDAVWADDFHHAMHALLTGEHNGYYQDFGGFEHLVKAVREGWSYAGDYSEYRKRPHGRSPRDVRAGQVVVCAQNHDQVGNRMLGERLSALVPFEALKLAAGAVLLAPFIPLLFMGEEYAETNPFQYFVSHGDCALIEAVRRGRREEFARFCWNGSPPDPQDRATFDRSRLNYESRTAGHHNVLLQFHKELIGLRKTVPALAVL
ncbi:MAG: malto-oligosyltrehalose trehalohydrolase, partial [Polyangiaceae bacterium]|nr:malto-oligosyltrehalose trehalohydrolase [Polyangiaceae bacterium]